MKFKNMRVKKIIASFIILILVIETVVFLGVQFKFNPLKAAHLVQADSETIGVKSVGSAIQADGKITARNQATLHFQTGGKLVSLSAKEGDTVYQGQAIAQLDTYTLERQLKQTLNKYRSTRDTFDQAQQNAQDNVLPNIERPLLPGPEMDQSNAINDAVKRILDQNQANLDNSVIDVELADYAQQLATVTSPMDGILIHEDVDVANQNVTPQTSFVVADPSTVVFRAEVSDSEISYVSVDTHATITLNGDKQTVTGTVTKISPTKTAAANGEQTYAVDIQSDGLQKLGKLDQDGSVQIDSNAKQNFILIPAWTVLNGKYVWVNENGTPKLREITVGQKHGDQIEVTHGLSDHDTVIIHPQSIIKKEYPIL